MKKLISIVAAMAMLSGCAALAESVPAAYTPINPGESLTVDLDGDGVSETVSTEYIADEYGFEELYIHVGTAAGTIDYNTEFALNESVGIADLDGDGIWELLASGDVMSDDYYTVCLQFSGNVLKPMLFSSVNRGDVEMDTYHHYGYGMIVDIAEDGTLTLSGSQDMLGTWFADRSFALIDGVFETVDNGLWTRALDLTDPDLWEYGALIAKTEIPCSFIDEAGTMIEGVLVPGEKIVVTATDKQELVYFVTEDGRQGSIIVYADWDTGWGSMVNDLPESEAFDNIRYAD